MTTDGAPGGGPVAPGTIPTPRIAQDDLEDDDTQVLPPVPADIGTAAADDPSTDAPAAEDSLSTDAPADAAAAGDGLPAGHPTGTADADLSPADEPLSTPVAVPPPPLARVDDARVYVDGSALSRYLVGAPARDAWLAWAREHEAELVTTPLGLTELRRIAQPRGIEARGTAVDVSGRIEVARFSDQTLRKASKVSAVLPPFVALHLGAALAHPGVTTVATYDRQLAQVAALYGLTVVSPGWPDRWWEQ